MAKDAKNTRRRAYEFGSLRLYDDLISTIGSEDWYRDSVEFFIDEDNERNGDLDSNSTQFRIHAEEQLESYVHWRVPKQAVKFTDTGYVVEIAYEFSDFDYLEDGHVIGFDLQVNDDAEGNGLRHACLGWSDTTDKASSDNTTWGTLTFSTQRLAGAQGGGGASVPSLLEKDNVYNLWTEDIVYDCYSLPNQTSIEATEEGALLTGTDPEGAPVDPFVSINLKKYAATVQAPNIACSEYPYVVFKVKATGTTGDCELYYTNTPQAGCFVTGYYEPDGTWQYVLFDLSYEDDWAAQRSPASVRLDWALNFTGEATEASLVVGEIAFFKTEDEAYAYTGLTPETTVEAEAETETETQAQTTDAPATEQKTEPAEEQSGCKSLLCASVLPVLPVLPVLLLGCALAVNKKKH